MTCPSVSYTLGRENTTKIIKERLSEEVLQSIKLCCVQYLINTGEFVPYVPLPPPHRETDGAVRRLLLLLFAKTPVAVQQVEELLEKPFKR